MNILTKYGYKKHSKGVYYKDLGNGIFNIFTVEDGMLYTYIKCKVCDLFPKGFFRKSFFRIKGKSALKQVLSCGFDQEYYKVCNPYNLLTRDKTVNLFNTLMHGSRF